MKQINHGFKCFYYLLEDGGVYNAKTNRYLKPSRGSYKLRTEDNETQYISISALTQMIYGYSIIKDDIPRLPGERFVPIPGTDGKYLISDQGRIISYSSSTAHLLKPSKNKDNGYLRINIKIDGKYYSKLVHQLVAEAFCAVPDGQDRANLQIHHKDFSKTLNVWTNLEYLTPAEHIKKHLEHDERSEANNETIFCS